MISSRAKPNPPNPSSAHRPETELAKRLRVLNTDQTKVNP